MEKLLIVQGMGIAEEVERRSDGLLNERYIIQCTKKNVQLFAETSISTSFYAAGYLALIWCSFKMLIGQMSFGSLTAIIQLVNQLQAPFVNISGSLPKYIAMIASAERLMELYQIQGEAAEMIDDPDKIYSAMTELGASGLSFSYEQSSVFNNAEFSLPKGSFAVVTGASGIGKSTLLKLLLGIFNPNSGTMYIKLSGETLPLDRSCRSLFAYVPQGNMLFSGTLRDNLSIVKPDASEEEIAQAVYVSAMDEYLPLLPMGLDTVLGESGAGLSEGQVQRLAIARAVLGGAPILLLDECSSALDEATEKKVLQRLKALKNRTCIAVTHRPAAIEMCSWRLEVSDGSIIAVKNETQAKETE
jgi:ATP-binding cassette subfamily B protein